MPWRAYETGLLQTSQMAQGVDPAETATLHDKRGGHRIMIQKYLNCVSEPCAFRGNELHGSFPPCDGVFDVATEVQRRLADVVHERFQTSVHGSVNYGSRRKWKERQALAKAAVS